MVMMRATEESSCCNARLGSLIYGIIMSVISGLGLLAAIGGFTYMNFIMWFQKYYVESSNSYKYVYMPPQSDMFLLAIIIVALCTLGLIFLIMEFSFSFSLAYGASKRKPDHLKVYFVYGIVKIVITLVMSIAMCVVLWDDNPTWLTVFLIYCSVNAMLLMMVYKARQQMLKDTNGYSYNKFVNDFPIKA